MATKAIEKNETNVEATTKKVDPDGIEFVRYFAVKPSPITRSDGSTAMRVGALLIDLGDFHGKALSFSCPIIEEVREGEKVADVWGPIGAKVPISDTRKAHLVKRVAERLAQGALPRYQAAMGNDPDRMARYQGLFDSFRVAAGLDEARGPAEVAPDEYDNL